MLVVAAKTKGLFEEEVDDLMAVARAVGLTTHGSASREAIVDSLRPLLRIVEALRPQSQEIVEKTLRMHAGYSYQSPCHNEQSNHLRVAPSLVRHTQHAEHHPTLHEQFARPDVSCRW